jgi:diguanylate cyclase (GGDEF)-like protein
MRILVVDDSKISQVVFDSILRDAGYADVVAVGCASEALRVVEEGSMAGGIPVDLILMDIMMPDMDGIETCRRLKKDERLQDIPVIIISGLGETEKLEAAFTAGAVDYISKPANKTELLVRVRSALRLKQEMDRRKGREQELLTLTSELEILNKKLEELSCQDSLTGIANRRTFDDFLSREWKRGARDASSFSLLMIDIDFFKIFNDTYGHQAGDDCLKMVAEALQKVVRRPGDLLARYGGEEFVAVLPDTGLFGAGILAENMCAVISELRVPHERSSVAEYVTISVGVASAEASSDVSPHELIAAADSALYRAKQGGRNRTEVISLH